MSSTTKALPDSSAPESRSATAIARAAMEIEVKKTFAEAESVWRLLEQDAVHTPYQRFDWQEAFHRHLGAGAAACIAVIRDGAGTPQALLPLMVANEHGLGTASFIGGKHANFAMGLWRPAFAAAITEERVHAILAAIARQAPRRIDVFRLQNQPLAWAGMGNPLRLLAHQPSASFGYHLALEADDEAVLGRVVSASSRRKMRKKERNLAEMGEVRFSVARSRDEALRLLDTFLRFKAHRFRELGIANAFAEPGVEAFLREAVLRGLDEGRPAIELCALTVGGEPVSMFGGVVAAGRYSAMFNAMAPGPIQHESPGELVLHHLIRDCCRRGLSVFDLGAGEAQYKANICDGVDPLFDQFIPMTWRGQAFATAYSAAAHAKRRVKQSDLLWSLVQRLRRMRVGR